MILPDMTTTIKLPMQDKTKDTMITQNPLKRTHNSSSYSDTEIPQSIQT